MSKFSLPTFLAQVAKARDAWLADIQSRGGVEAFVQAYLDGQLRSELPRALLGVERSFSDWRLVRTPTGKDSPLGEEVRARAQATASALVEKALKDYTPPTKVLKTIRAAYEEQLEYQGAELATKQAAERMEEIVAQAISAEFPEDAERGVYDASGALIGYLKGKTFRPLTQETS